MEHYSTTFFCKDKKEPACQVSIGYSDMHQYYNAFIRIGDSQNSIDIHLDSIQDLVNFKNSFLSSFEKAMREAKYA